MYIFCSRSRISHLSNEFWFLLLQNSIRNQDLSTRFACCYYNAVASRASQLTVQEKYTYIFIHTHTHICIQICMYAYTSHIYVHIYIYIQTYIHIHTYKYICTSICINIFLCSHLYLLIY